MSTGTRQLVRQRSPLFLFTGIAYLLLLAAGYLFLLAIANVRSRIYYHGPNYGFLFWMSLYCLVVALGLFGRRKWALIALFVPGVLTVTILAVGMLRQHRASDSPSLVFMIGFIAIIVGVPATMLRDWHELRW